MNSNNPTSDYKTIFPPNREWPSKRADSVSRCIRKQVTAQELAGRSVFHYSIPVVLETGTGRIEEGSEISSNKFVLGGGELLVSKLNPRKGCVAISHCGPQFSICSTEFVVLQPLDSFELRYAFYIYSSESARQYFDSMTESATLSHKRVEPGIVSKLWLAVPPPAIQRCIADFLDHKTAAIDALIEKKQKLVELLTEKRAALINQAVTKGLDPTVPMKDSGIPWIGEIPVLWVCTTIRRALRFIEQGWSPQCDSHPVSGDDWGVLKSGCTAGGKYNPEANKTLPAGLAPRVHLVVKEGDVLVCRASGSPEIVGSAALVPATEKNLMLSDKVFRLKVVDSVHPPFLVFALASKGARSQLENMISGAEGLANNLPQARLKELILALPPFIEQRAIAEYLDARLNSIEDLRTKVVAQISRLQEYRQALITAAVTGQLEIPEDSQ